jgi:hypothetical protein
MTLVYIHSIMPQSAETQSQEKEGKSVATLQEEMLGDLETIDIGSPQPIPSGKNSVVGESVSADDKGDQWVEIDLGGFEERQNKNKSILEGLKNKLTGGKVSKRIIKGFKTLSSIGKTFEERGDKLIKELQEKAKVTTNKAGATAAEAGKKAAAAAEKTRKKDQKALTVTDTFANDVGGNVSAALAFHVENIKKDHETQSLELNSLNQEQTDQAAADNYLERDDALNAFAGILIFDGLAKIAKGVKSARSAAQNIQESKDKAKQKAADAGDNLTQGSLQVAVGGNALHENAENARNISAAAAGPADGESMAQVLTSATEPTLSATFGAILSGFKLIKTSVDAAYDFGKIRSLRMLKMLSKKGENWKGIIGEALLNKLGVDGLKLLKDSAGLVGGVFAAIGTGGAAIPLILGASASTAGIAQLLTKIYLQYQNKKAIRDSKAKKDNDTKTASEILATGDEPITIDEEDIVDLQQNLKELHKEIPKAKLEASTKDRLIKVAQEINNSLLQKDKKIQNQTYKEIADTGAAKKAESRKFSKQFKNEVSKGVEKVGNSQAAKELGETGRWIANTGAGKTVAAMGSAVGSKAASVKAGAGETFAAAGSSAAKTAQEITETISDLSSKFSKTKFAKGTSAKAQKIRENFTHLTQLGSRLISGIGSNLSLEPSTLEYIERKKTQVVELKEYCSALLVDQGQRLAAGAEKLGNSKAVKTVAAAGSKAGNVVAAGAEMAGNAAARTGKGVVGMTAAGAEMAGNAAARAGKSVAGITAAGAEMVGNSEFGKSVAAGAAKTASGVATAGAKLGEGVAAGAAKTASGVATAGAKLGEGVAAGAEMAGNVAASAGKGVVDSTAYMDKTLKITETIRDLSSKFSETKPGQILTAGGKVASNVGKAAVNAGKVAKDSVVATGEGAKNLIMGAENSEENPSEMADKPEDFKEYFDARESVRVIDVPEESATVESIHKQISVVSSL